MFNLLESYDLLYFFFTWTLYNFTLYILIINNENDLYFEKSMIVTIKYFLLSSISNLLFLYGLSVVYQEIGNFSYDSIILLLNQYPDEIDLEEFLFILNIIFIFKLGIAPLHFWAPDVYSNIPLKTMIYLSIIPKIFYIFLIINLSPILYNNIDVLYFSAILSIIIGSIGLTQQYNIKRFLTYSSIANLGYFILSYNNISI